MQTEGEGWMPWAGGQRGMGVTAKGSGVSSWGDANASERDKGGGRTL